MVEGTNTTKHTKVWKVLVVFGTLAFVAVSLIPYQSEAVRGYTLTVVNEEGTPVSDVTIVRETKGGSLIELKEMRNTDEQGHAQFPPRFDYDNMLFRAFRGALGLIDNLLTMGHARTDVFIFVSSSPTDTYQESGFGGFYGYGQPPAELKVHRWDTTDPSYRKYPEAWFASDPDPNKPAWEILSHEAKYGEVILSKRTELGILSNFAATPFVLDGKRYASVEGFWQMMLYPEGSDDERAKAKGVEWKFTREQVAQMTAFDAKAAGTLAEENMKTLGIDWCMYNGKRFPYRSATPGEHYKLIVAAMRAKLNQNPEVKRVLLATGDLKLRPDHIEEPNAPPEWHYYEIWMQLRAELQKQPGPSK